MNNDFLTMLSQFKNPKEAVMKIIGQNANPFQKNLIDLANQGNIEELKKIGRNLYKQQGKNFDDTLSQLESIKNNFIGKNN